MEHQQCRTPRQPRQPRPLGREIRARRAPLAAGVRAPRRKEKGAGPAAARPRSDPLHPGRSCRGVPAADLLLRPRPGFAWAAWAWWWPGRWICQGWPVRPRWRKSQVGVRVGVAARCPLGLPTLTFILNWLERHSLRPPGRWRAAGLRSPGLAPCALPALPAVSWVGVWAGRGWGRGGAGDIDVLFSACMLRPAAPRPSRPGNETGHAIHTSPGPAWPGGPGPSSTAEPSQSRPAPPRQRRRQLLYLCGIPHVCHPARPRPQRRGAAALEERAISTHCLRTAGQAAPPRP